MQITQSYPKIQIDPGSVIKPCIAANSAKDSFVDRPTSKWRSLINIIRNEGFLWILKTVATIDVEATTKNKYYSYGLRAAQIIAMALLRIHQMYKTIYAYFYPYSMLDHDHVCDIFSRCFDWSTAVIKAFAWHPNHDRCAVAISNDCIHIYESSNRTRLLRHHRQRKIVDMVWHPNDRELLIVATQTNIIFWLIPAGHNHKPSQATNKIINDIIKPPITCVKFDIDGSKLFVCSPNSSRIKVLNVKEILEGSPSANGYTRQVTNWDFQGVTKMSWSPDKIRVVTATTSNFIRVYESLQWSSNKWCAFSNVVQDFVWSRPSGKFLLLAPSDEPCLYVLPFLDTALANDVGGTKSIMKALDLSEQLGEDGATVGGRVRSLVWDKNGKRLAISFKDNPDSILLFKTSEKPTVEFQQIGVIQSYTGSTPLIMEFHDKFKDGSLLTICWSDGNCQHVPMVYSLPDQHSKSSPKPNNYGPSSQKSISSPRSLTNFCQSSRLNKTLNKSHLM